LGLEKEGYVLSLQSSLKVFFFQKQKALFCFAEGVNIRPSAKSTLQKRFSLLWHIHQLDWLQNFELLAVEYPSDYHLDLRKSFSSLIGNFGPSWCLWAGRGKECVALYFLREAEPRGLELAQKYSLFPLEPYFKTALTSIPNLHFSHPALGG
jgi:hypothetical protein